MAAQLDADHLGRLELERRAREARGHLQSARADGDHPKRARSGRVAVGADQELAGAREAFDVQVVTDPVARAREMDSVLRAERLQEAVVIRVLEVELDRIVIDVLHR
jgi:hypothetical protein